ncbi:inactive peptidyl-prolyl cis-trans isomerase shutdown-like [Anopheles ziemanni]|uniref:inactive peptidyl-prolyl cis-trans isomerase shutdown-like n=1 Tax=Anopheles coustani TaxID=139045 RepID=UPI0026585D7D|nr:inactive peptidyl-prolyl cis-trans isomerase shutdown-like [Anopheles coustani]XP_058174225.1 inactive peptidyl-prolyl cis-trans isomerase shutdown-like [Anopheles ziemanni]
MARQNVLKQPVGLEELINGGASFSVDTELMEDNKGSENFMEDEYGSATDDDEDYKLMISPWDGSFDELRGQMDKISEYIYKRIKCKGVGEPFPEDGNFRVMIQYNAFQEKIRRPFDSTTLRSSPCQFLLGDANVLPGLDAAVRTMRVSEESEFVISYKLLFGELGCLDRIGPKSDCLYVIRLIRAEDVGDCDALTKLVDTDRRSYSKVKERVTQIRTYAKDCFKRKLLSNAIVKYLEAVEALHLCQLDDADEENELKDTMIALYTSLAVCYNQKDQPKDAHRMLNELRRYCDLTQNAKALYQEGKALHKLGEFSNARNSLNRALVLQPNDKNIQAALKELEATVVKNRRDEKNMWSRAFGMPGPEQQEKIAEQNSDFRQAANTSVLTFVDDENLDTFYLPNTLSETELSILKELCEQYKLKLSFDMDNNKKRYKLQKKSAP